MILKLVLDHKERYHSLPFCCNLLECVYEYPLPSPPLDLRRAVHESYCVAMVHCIRDMNRHLRHRRKMVVKKFKENQNANAPFKNRRSTQLSHSVWPQTFTSNFNDGFRYFVVLHRGHTWSSMVYQALPSSYTKRTCNETKTKHNC